MVDLESLLTLEADSPLSLAVAPVDHLAAPVALADSSHYRLAASRVDLNSAIDQRPAAVELAEQGILLWYLPLEQLPYVLTGAVDLTSLRDSRVLWEGVLVSILAALLFGSILTLLFRRMVMTRVHTLADLMAQISDTRQLGRFLTSPAVTAETRRYDEFGEIATRLSSVVCSLLLSIGRQRRADRYDNDTGLLNRSAFINELESRPQRPLIFYVVGISNYRQLSLIYGAQAVEDMVVSISVELKACFPRAKLGRLSVASYGVLATEGDGGKGSHDDGAHNIQMNLLAKLKEGLASHGHNLNPHFRIGVYCGSRPAEALDHATYAYAQAQKRGGFYVFGERDASLLQRRQQVNALFQQALESGAITPHYQLQLLPEQNKVIGVEALARWPGTDFYPDEFIAVAVAKSMVTDLDMAICRQVVADAQLLVARYGSDFTLSVNLSYTTAINSDAIRALIAVIEESPLPNATFVFEITETELEECDDNLPESVAMIYAAGIGVSLDDFGAGHSSLQRLRRLKVSELKIDRSYTARTDTEDGRNMLDSMIRLGMGQQLKIVVEGVETQAQADFVSGYGERGYSVYQQGYFHARPQPLTQLPTAAELWPQAAGDCDRAG